MKKEVRYFLEKFFLNILKWNLCCFSFAVLFHGIFINYFYWITFGIFMTVFLFRTCREMQKIKKGKKPPLPDRILFSYYTLLREDGRLIEEFVTGLMECFGVGIGLSLMGVLIFDGHFTDVWTYLLGSIHIIILNLSETYFKATKEEKPKKR